jgi:RNA polymerase primary sigma factor
MVDDGSLALYLKQIAKTAPLSSKEEAELTVRIRNGDRAAFEKLVTANLRFVVSVSHMYANQGLPLSDLINEGNVGLMRAARRFDEKKNFRFISYAVWWIRQGILQALAEQSRIVRLPLNRVSSMHKIGQADIRLRQRHQRSPSPEEIAAECGLRERDVQRMLRVGNRHVSLDAPTGDERTSLYDKLAVDEGAEDDATTQVFLRDELARTLASLEPRERSIILLYFGIDQDTSYTLEEIGRRLNLTRERVRQIKERALGKLKQPAVNHRLRAFSQCAHSSPISPGEQL